MLQDLRQGFRGLIRTPGFTAAAVLTLALGVGANTAIFQLIDAVALRSLPVTNPDELAEVKIIGGNGGFGVNFGPYGELTRPVWEELKRSQQAFSGMFAWSTPSVRIGPRENLHPASAIAVSGDFFRALGVQPLRGRLIEPQDETACPETVAVVSARFWQREMGGRELTADSRLIVNLQPVDVIGVAPPEFFGLAVGEQFDIALPLCRPAEMRRERFDIAVAGRLRPGWTIERASAHLNALSAAIFDATAPTEYSPASIARFKAFRLGAYPAASGVSALRSRYEDALRLLLAITALILLLACANLANLMLARGSARDREVAVRTAMGASRARVAREFLVESFLLGIAGAALAVVFARMLGRMILWALSTQGSSPTLILHTDSRVLLYAAGVAFATCLFFGIAPALRAARISPASATRSGGRGMTPGRERFSIQRSMVTVQIAISVVMLVAALLFVRSFRNLITFDSGIRQQDITIARLGFDPSTPPERFTPIRRELLADIKALPGVVEVGATSQVPLLGGSWSHGVHVADKEGSARFTWVSPGYFGTVGVPIVQGRDFTMQDTETSPRVAVVNREFIRQMIGSGNPLGQKLRTNPEPRYPSTVYEIVGIIPDTKYNTLQGQIPPMVFAPDSQHPSQGPGASLMIHSSVPSAVVVAAIREYLRRAHPGMIAEFSVFQAQIRDGLVRERLLAMLAGFFGLLAVLLAIIGLYGMISYGVSQRRPEIGVRIALGASRRNVIGLVMGEAGWLLLIGITIGSAISLVAGRGISTLLFGLQPNDLPTLAAACALLALIAAAASFVPARRASRIDPATMLRDA